MSVNGANELAVSVRGLTFGWGRRPVLKSMDLDVKTGEVTALVGANGAGKSTLLSVLSGSEIYRSRLLPSRRGTKVEVLGYDPARRGHKVRSSVGYVPDRTELPGWMQVSDHLALVRAIHPRWQDALAERWLDAFRLDRRARYADLSKGQRMLENLVCALAFGPPLFVRRKTQGGRGSEWLEIGIDEAVPFHPECGDCWLTGLDGERWIATVADRNLYVLDAAGKVRHTLRDVPEPEPRR